MLEFTLDVSSLAFLSGAFARIRSLTIVLIMLLADFNALIRVPAPKFEHLKYLKLQPIMLLSLLYKQVFKMKQKQYLEEKP